MSTESSIDHLLGSTQEELPTITDRDFSQDSLSIVYSDQDNSSSYKTVRRENHVACGIPESKRNG
jgi:hypothetical protein